MYFDVFSLISTKNPNAKIYSLESNKMLGGSTMSAANALQSMNNSTSSTAMNVSTSSYNSDRSSVTTGLDVEFANDAASGGFFNSDYKKYVRIFERKYNVWCTL